MEVVEDDLFFADLSKRISLLIMDDDEQHPAIANYPLDSFQAFSRGTNPNTQSPSMYEQTWRRSDSKGTGVFIPRSTYPRRKNKQQKSVAKSPSKRSHPNNNTSSNHNCFNPSSRC